MAYEDDLQTETETETDDTATTTDDTATTTEAETEETATAGEEQGESEGGETASTVNVSAAGDNVKSSNITVAGKHFVDWFNTDFLPTQKGNHETLTLWKKPAPKFPARVAKAAFVEVFDHCDELWAAELTYGEFLALFCVFYNETGGSFVPVSERGSLRYLFEPTAGGKASYNQAPNRLAGDQLLGREFIEAGEEKAWNARTPYPGAPDGSALEDAVKECDFYKFRGRGLIQLTWRDTYLKAIDPLLATYGYDACDDLSEAELGRIIRTDARIFRPMVKGYLEIPIISKAFASVNADPADFTPFGRRVSGGAEYAALLQWRCETLAAAMNDAGFQCD